MIVLPTSYLPSIQYFGMLAKSKKVFIETYETYPKQTIRNRCTIYTSNGKLDLIIPVKKPNGNHTKTRDIKICYNEKWQAMHWRAIESAYNSSPFFLFYKDDFRDILLSGKYNKLIEINHSLTTLIIDLTGIKVDMEFSTSFRKTYDQDYRNFKPLKGVKNIFPVYKQVFDRKHGFIQNLSIIDLLFNKGPDTIDLIKK